MSTSMVGAPVVWAGRRADRPPSALDSWNCDRSRLFASLDDAGELIVLDALSYPWESMRATDWDIPLSLVLPAELDMSTIIEVFGGLVLDRLTPMDLLVWTDPDVATLGARFGLETAQCHQVDDAGTAAELACLREARAPAVRDHVTDLGVFRGLEGDLVSQHLDEYGAHQRGGLNALLAVVRTGDVVVDIGAHIGTFTVPLARAVGSEGHVVAIEGYGPTADLLRHNVTANDVQDRVTTLQAVVGAGPATLHASLVVGNTGATTFVQRDAPSASAVQVATLDELWRSLSIPAPSVIKMDVEGAELSVLHGAHQLVADGRPIFMMEVSDAMLRRHGEAIEALEAWLDSHDYRCWVISGPRNTTAPDWLLEPLPSLRSIDDSIVDIMVEPSESTRLEDAVIGVQRSESPDPPRGHASPRQAVSSDVGDANG